LATLRDLTVSIDFDDVDVTRLTSVNTALDEIEDQLRQMGANIQLAGTNTQQMGTQATTALNQVSNNANQATNQVNNTGQAADDAGGSFTMFGKVGAAAIGAITAAAGVALGAVSAVFTEMDESFDRLEAKTGENGAKLEGLKNVVTDVFNNAYGESIGQVTDDVATLNAMFDGLSERGMQSLAEGAYTISDLWGAEVKEVGKTVKTMTATFDGLTNTDAMDLMTTAFQKTGDYSDDLLDTFNEYSVYFKELGFDAEGFTNILVKGAEAGAFTMDKAADAIKEFGIRSIDASDTTADGFKAIGLDAELMTNNFAAGGEKAQQAFAATVSGLAAMKDPVEQNAAGVALFGTQWEDLREDVVLAMADGTNALGDFRGATQEAADTAYDNFGSRMTGLFRTLKTEAAKVFEDAGGKELLEGIITKAEELKPVILDLIAGAVDFAQKVRDNWPAIVTTVLTLGSAVGTFAILMAGWKIIGTINGLIAAWRAGTLLQTAAQWGLNTALLANPITWIIVGISALIAIGVLLWRNWDTVKAKAGELWAKTKEVFGNIYNWTKEKIQPVVDWFKGLGDKFNDFKTAISNFKMPKWVTSIGETLSGAASKVKGFFDGSHATGLANVPHNGYVAELHKGEAVLTAKQSNALRAAGILSESAGKPVLEMGQNIGANSGGRVTSGSTFAPQITIQIDGANGNEATIARLAADAAQRQIEKFWRQMVAMQG
jgi:phage-related minor tail protein